MTLANVIQATRNEVVHVFIYLVYIVYLVCI